MSLKLVHVVSQQLELRYQELLLFRYVYRPQVEAVLSSALYPGRR